jgi:gp16 family phage-associated protein
MKPRLKLLLNGQITLATQGTSGLDELQTAEFINRHFGTKKRLAKKIGQPTRMLALALSPSSIDLGGKVSKVRLMLGLPSNPTQRSLAYVAAHEKKKHRPATSHRFAHPAAMLRTPESHEDLSVSSKAAGVGTPMQVAEHLERCRQAQKQLTAAGMSVAEWARKHGTNRSMTYQVLRGEKKGRRGEAHRIAVLLGIKQGVA